MGEMDPTTESLLEQIEDILGEGKTTLGGGKIKVDKNAIIEVIQEIRLQMPDELIQARRIATHRKKIIDDATAIADEKIALAQKEAARLVEETEIVKKARASAVEIITQAKAQSDDIIAKAKADADTIAENADKWARDLRAAAGDFVDRVLNDCDELLSKSIDGMNADLRDIRTSREQFRQAIAKFQ